MKNEPILPPPSPSPDSFTCCKGNFPTRLSRRDFLKRGGGATVASLVAWQGLAQIAAAADNNANASCTHPQFYMTDYYTGQLAGSSVYYCGPIYTCTKCPAQFSPGGGLTTCTCVGPGGAHRPIDRANCKWKSVFVV